MTTLNYRFATELPKVEAEFKGDVITLTDVKVGAVTYDDIAHFTATLRRNGEAVASVSSDGSEENSRISFTDISYAISLKGEGQAALAYIAKHLCGVCGINEYVKRHQNNSLILFRGMRQANGGIVVTELRRVLFPTLLKQILAEGSRRKAFIGILKSCLALGYEILNTNLAELNA